MKFKKRKAMPRPLPPPDTLPTYEIKARPTVYKSITFRSQLEAQWASMFDYLKWKWDYEPFCVGGLWLPDFVIRNYIGRDGEPFSILIEVKPDESHVIQAKKKIDAAYAKEGGWVPYIILGGHCNMLYHDEHMQPWHDDACFIECKLQSSRNWNRALLRVKQQN